MTMALNSTQAPAQNLAYNGLAGSDAAGQSDGGTHRTGAPTCYYPLAPAQRGTGNDTPARPFMGSAMKGTVGYERFVHALMAPRSNFGDQPGMDRGAAEAAVDNLRIKPGTILLAPCHPGHSEAYRQMPAASTGGQLPAGTPRGPRRARQTGSDTHLSTSTTSGSDRVDRSAYSRDSGVRRSLAANGVAVYPDGWADGAGDTQPAEAAPCRVASRWRHVLNGVASLLSPMVWLLPMAARPEQARPTNPAAECDRPLDADTSEPAPADDLQSYERYLAAVSYGNAY